MPEMHYEIAWPDGARESCYSPSLVIKEFFSPGESYGMKDFMERSRTALTIASERVRQKFGMPCSLALAQLARLEQAAEHFAALPQPRITVLAFHE